MDTFICQNCGKENLKSHQTTNKYCNNSCQQEAQYKKRIVEWKKTGKFSKGPVKRYLSEQKEGCWTCGINKWNNKPLVLELEHIDGDSNNNTEDNLSLLCPNCHSQTDTYKGKNRGKGRYARRERYAEGKSF